MARFKHFFALVCWDSWSVVFDVYDLFAVTPNTNGHVRFTVFDSVPEQVLEHVS